MCFNGLLYLQLKKYFMVHGIDIKITSSLSTTINQTPGFPFQDNWSGVQLRGFCPGLPVCPKHSHEPPDKMSGLVRVGKHSTYSYLWSWTPFQGIPVCSVNKNLLIELATMLWTSIGWTKLFFVKVQRSVFLKTQNLETIRTNYSFLNKCDEEMH